MTRDDIRHFLDRDWARIASAKPRTWQAGKQTPADDLRAADELRRHVAAIRPDWPDAGERAEDLRTHLRVSAALRSVRIDRR